MHREQPGPRLERPQRDGGRDPGDHRRRSPASPTARSARTSGGHRGCPNQSKPSIRSAQVQPVKPGEGSEEPKHGDQDGRVPHAFSLLCPKRRASVGPIARRRLHRGHLGAIGGLGPPAISCRCCQEATATEARRRGLRSLGARGMPETGPRFRRPEAGELGGGLASVAVSKSLSSAACTRSWSTRRRSEGTRRCAERSPSPRRGRFRLASRDRRGRSPQPPRRRLCLRTASGTLHAEPDDPGQEPGHPARGTQTERRIGQAELRTAAANRTSHISANSKPPAMRTLDRGDDRPRARPERGRHTHVARDRRGESVSSIASIAAMSPPAEKAGPDPSAPPRRSCPTGRPPRPPRATRRASPA